MNGLLKTSDLVAASIGQGLQIIDGETFNYDEWLVSVGLRASGRALFKNMDIPEKLLILNKGNIIAGLTTGLYASFFKNKSNKEALKIGVNGAISNILGTEILERLEVEDKDII